MTDKERIENVKDFLGNELKVGDSVVINQNTRTGSSTIRKMLKEATVTGFTKCQVITTRGRIYPDDVIKSSSANQNAKAVEALERVKAHITNSAIVRAEDRIDFIKDFVLDLIKEYGGEE